MFKIHCVKQNMLWLVKIIWIIFLVKESYFHSGNLLKPSESKEANSFYYEVKLGVKQACQAILLKFYCTANFAEEEAMFF